MANEKRLIDANALLEELDKFANPMPNESGYEFLRGIATAITEIEDAPTVDAVEVVHGRWIVENEESIRCSECCFNRASIKIPLDYCPNCCAKMDGDGNGNL